MMNPNAGLDATYDGFVGSTYDALILFEACISGQIKHVSRRPHDRERDYVIQSGKVFIYEENTSGIKRWTDGISWSPSRILGNFLIYRQLVKAFGPGEKKKAIKKSKFGPISNIKNDQINIVQEKDAVFKGVEDSSASGSSYGQTGNINAETERALIGSLTDSYDFLENGLVKKTISVSCDDVAHHLVSYYTIADALSQKLMVPSKDPRFLNTYPRPSLLNSPTFRNPVDDVVDRSMYLDHRYDLISQGFLPSHIPIAAERELHDTYIGAAVGIYNTHHSMPMTTAAYGNSSPTYTTNINYSNIYASAPLTYQSSQRLQQYNHDYCQRYIDTSSSSSNSGFGPMYIPLHIQREPPILQRRHSEDSGVSMSADKIVKDTAYHHSQNSCYDFPQESNLRQNIVGRRDALRGPALTDINRQVSFDRPNLSVPNIRIAISVDSKDGWQVGNSSVGHGHYQQL